LSSIPDPQPARISDAATTAVEIPLSIYFTGTSGDCCKKKIVAGSSLTWLWIMISDGLQLVELFILILLARAFYVEGVKQCEIIHHDHQGLHAEDSSLFLSL
jgi:hypothetical protein